MKPNKQQECFDLFDMYPNAKVPLLAKRSGIGASTLYRYRKEWMKYAAGRIAFQEVPKSRDCAKDVQMGVIAGFAAGAMFTIFAFLIAG